MVIKSNFSSILVGQIFIFYNSLPAQMKRISDKEFLASSAQMLHCWYRKSLVFLNYFSVQVFFASHLIQHCISSLFTSSIPEVGGTGGAGDGSPPALWWGVEGAEGAPTLRRQNIINMRIRLNLSRMKR